MRVLVCSLTISSVLAVACGASRPANAPAARDEEPQTVEQALAQIDQARQALGMPAAAPSGGGASSTTTTPSADAPAEKKPSPPPPEPPRAEQDSDDGKRDRCASSCHAIVSMRRAVEALCRIAGDTDSRCTDAKRTLEASERRVTACGC